MTWSDAARRAAAEVRRIHGKKAYYYAPITGAKVRRPITIMAKNRTEALERQFKLRSLMVERQKQLATRMARKAVTTVSTSSKPGWRAPVGPRSTPMERNYARVMAGGNKWQIENMNAVGNNPYRRY